MKRTRVDTKFYLIHMNEIDSFQNTHIIDQIGIEDVRNDMVIIEARDIIETTIDHILASDIFTCQDMV